jgi:hypothetical protein
MVVETQVKAAVRLVLLQLLILEVVVEAVAQMAQIIQTAVLAVQGAY